MMHIFSMKGRTKKMEIKQIADAPLYYIPLHQYSGQPATPVVNIGSEVKKYQLIGQTNDELSANVHSPVSGMVQNITEHPQPDGTMLPTIIIRNDYKDEEVEVPAIDYNALTAEEIVNIIQTCGIVGEGGAQFPTALKYKLEGREIHTFIVNGTECEPYLTADYAVMAHRTEELFKGINIINKVLKADNIVISIEEQNEELQKVFVPFLQKEEYRNFRVVVLPNEYPQGGELQLIKSVTGIELARNQRPREAGVIVNNVGTIHAIYQAVVNRRPLVSRIITVSGEESKNYGNYEVKIGTPVYHIMESLGLSGDNTVVLGGPMMGKHITNMSVAISKGCSAVLLFKEEKVKRSNCISCGYCVDVCPMHLMPMKFEEIYRKGKYFNLEKYSISSCIECAACEYICPSNVPLIESIKEGKMKLKQLANAIR